MGLSSSKLRAMTFGPTTLGHVSSLDCEPLQLDKHHCMSYPLRVNMRVDKPFDFVHSDVWRLCLVSSKLDFRYSMKVTKRRGKSVIANQYAKIHNLK